MVDDVDVGEFLAEGADDGFGFFLGDETEEGLLRWTAAHGCSVVGGRSVRLQK